MLSPYALATSATNMTADDVADLKQAFSAHLNCGDYNDARHLMDVVRAESTTLADELYQLALLGHGIVLD